MEEKGKSYAIRLQLMLRVVVELLRRMRYVPCAACLRVVRCVLACLRVVRCAYAGHDAG